METEVKKLYVDTKDEYENSSLSFDGYLISYFQDGHVGQDYYVIEEKYYTLDEFIQKRNLRNYLQDKIQKYERSDWAKILDPQEFKAGMEFRISELNAVVDIIEESENE